MNTCVGAPEAYKYANRLVSKLETLKREVERDGYRELAQKIEDVIYRIEDVIRRYEKFLENFCKD